ncbi:MAG: glycine--tRNA ligase subunit beta, partial [Schwartzia sp.]|nr:glycine--tRNA ligase subunit beta [Schwartzia sp. (in: firmicutes)]
SLLPEILKGLVTGLAFPNSMRWGSLDFRFIRPLRWLVALYGEDVVPFEVASVHSGRASRGHRFLGHETFEIAKASDYISACENEFIIVDQDRRRDMIRAQIEETAKANGGVAEITEDLLEEVTYLVEYPTALCGNFEEKYLALPPEAVITPMRDHQRYFPVKDAAGKLLPLFITVRNGGKDYLDVVQHGNERVLRARLADAQFFFDEDRKKPLEKHLEKLKTVVFQEGLGTVYDKAGRLERLAATIADTLGVDAAEKTKAMRAAKLAKADLVTGMVTEFTELQGVMGRSYALLDGEDAEVAEAIDEHYLPRFAGDRLPQTTAGRIVSLADKIDNIVATFSRGLIPTGSQDPFALRRQALGLVRTVIEAKLRFSLSSLVAAAMDALDISDAAARDKMQADVAEFLRLRVKNVLDEAGVRYDVADAVLGDVDEICAVYQRAEAVAKALSEGSLNAPVQAFTRAGNLAQKAESAEYDAASFAVSEEKALAEAYEAAKSKTETCVKADDYTGAIAAISEMTKPIDAFFDAVMVMDEDAKVRANRLGLLKSIDALTKTVADFSKLVL